MSNNLAHMRVLKVQTPEQYGQSLPDRFIRDDHDYLILTVNNGDLFRTLNVKTDESLGVYWQSDWHYCRFLRQEQKNQASIIISKSIYQRHYIEQIKKIELDERPGDPIIYERGQSSERKIIDIFGCNKDGVIRTSLPAEYMDQFKGEKKHLRISLISPSGETDFWGCCAEVVNGFLEVTCDVDTFRRQMQNGWEISRLSNPNGDDKYNRSTVPKPEPTARVARDFEAYQAIHILRYQEDFHEIVLNRIHGLKKARKGQVYKVYFETDWWRGHVKDITDDTVILRFSDDYGVLRSLETITKIEDDTFGEGVEYYRQNVQRKGTTDGVLIVERVYKGVEDDIQLVVPYREYMSEHLNQSWLVHFGEKHYYADAKKERDKVNLTFGSVRRSNFQEALTGPITKINFNQNLIYEKPASVGAATTPAADERKVMKILAYGGDMGNKMWMTTSLIPGPWDDKKEDEHVGCNIKMSSSPNTWSVRVFKRPDHLLFTIDGGSILRELRENKEIAKIFLHGREDYTRPDGAQASGAKEGEKAVPVYVKSTASTTFAIISHGGNDEGADQWLTIPHFPGPWDEEDGVKVYLKLTNMDRSNMWRDRGYCGNIFKQDGQLKYSQRGGKLASLLQAGGQIEWIKDGEGHNRGSNTLYERGAVPVIQVVKGVKEPHKQCEGHFTHIPGPWDRSKEFSYSGFNAYVLMSSTTETGMIKTRGGWDCPIKVEDGLLKIQCNNSWFYDEVVQQGSYLVSITDKDTGKKLYERPAGAPHPDASRKNVTDASAKTTTESEGAYMALPKDRIEILRRFEERVDGETLGCFETAWHPELAGHESEDDHEDLRVQFETDWWNFTVEKRGDKAVWINTHCNTLRELGVLNAGQRITAIYTHDDDGDHDADSPLWKEGSAPVVNANARVKTYEQVNVIRYNEDSSGNAVMVTNNIANLDELTIGRRVEVHFEDDYWKAIIQSKTEDEVVFKFDGLSLASVRQLGRGQKITRLESTASCYVYYRRTEANEPKQAAPAPAPTPAPVSVPAPAQKQNQTGVSSTMTKSTATANLSDKIISALFAKVDAFVDITSGQVAVKTKNGLATLTVDEDGDFAITENPIESLGVQIPVYASRRPTTDIEVGDLFIKDSTIGFIVDVQDAKIRVLRPDGSEYTQKQVKSSFMGQSGFMVAKAPKLDGSNPLLMMSLLGDDDTDTDTIGLMLAMSNGGFGGGAGGGDIASLLPLLMASGDGDTDIKSLLPLLMMQGGAQGGGIAANPMMLLALTKDSDDSMLPLLLASQGGLGGAQGGIGSLLPLLLSKGGSGKKDLLPLLMMSGGFGGGGGLFGGAAAPVAAPVAPKAARKPATRKRAAAAPKAATTPATEA